MNIDKKNILVFYVCFKSSSYFFTRKDDFLAIIDLIYEENYSSAFHKISALIADSMEYIVTINL